MATICDNEPCNPPHFEVDHDVWVLGWKAASFDRLKAENEILRDAIYALANPGSYYNNRARARESPLEEIIWTGGTGHKKPWEYAASARDALEAQE